MCNEVASGNLDAGSDTSCIGRELGIVLIGSRRFLDVLIIGQVGHRSRGC